MHGEKMKFNELSFYMPSQETCNTILTLLSLRGNAECCES
jgi:hypothetical protein